MTHDAHDRGDEDGGEGDPGAHDNPHDTDADHCVGGRFPGSADSAERNGLVGAYDTLRGCGSGKDSCVSCVMHDIKEEERPGGRGVTGGEKVIHRRKKKKNTSLYHWQGWGLPQNR